MAGVSYKNPELVNDINNDMETKNLRIIISALVAQLEECGAKARVPKFAFSQGETTRIRTSKDAISGDVLLYTA
jgi:hypothetical protein